MTLYPSEYQHWAHTKNYSGNISSESSELRITYPRNDALFVLDSSLPEHVQVLRVLASGGRDKTAALFVDGEFAGICTDVFSWSIKMTRGMHTLTVECGGSSVSSSFAVQ